MAKGRKVRASRAAQGYVEFSHFPPAVHFDLIRKQAVVIHALSRYFFDSSEISERVNFCVMDAIKICRLGRQYVAYSSFSQPLPHLPFCLLHQYLVERRRVVTQLGKLD